MSQSPEQASAVSAEEIDGFFSAVFPGRNMPRHSEVARGRVTVELDCGERNLRPPDYINGPTQMTIADHAAYVAVFTLLGITPMALTSNLNINFLRPARGKVLVAEAEVMKHGRSSIVIEVTMRGKGAEKPASHAVVTYVVPDAASSVG